MVYSTDGYTDFIYIVAGVSEGNVQFIIGLNSMNLNIFYKWSHTFKSFKRTR